ncbi:hypothetical protein [Carboxydocella sp. ULO1]|nr:hypothetical protein [Carboxydocella sp. ULO1]GAW29195.1 hypothetical protein ULO1_17650 [Carboxydocella sp. ULO1]
MNPTEILETAKQLPLVITQQMQGVPPAVIIQVIAEEMQKLAETCRN